MNIVYFLYSIQSIFFYTLIFFWIYQLFICLFSCSKEKEVSNLINKNHKFMAIICARNEEKVIGSLIKSLNEQSYPYVDIFVIADNCTDKTAEIARFLGANVYERFDMSKRSKGYALEWFFDNFLFNFEEKYDAFTIFDADNIVATNFFEKINQKLCEGNKIIQGYRDIKNVSDSWITSNYAIFYWTMNRIYHYSRYKIGLSPLVNGTGFTVSMDTLQNSNGWHTSTLTEDIEFSIDNIIRGHKIAWAQDAIIYDEQPQKFIQSCRQRLRWSVGHIQCFKKFFSIILLRKEATAILLDTMIYTLGMPMMLLSIIISTIDIIKIISTPTFSSHIFIGGFKFATLTIAVSITQALLITILEKRNIKKVWKGIATYPIFLVSWFVINVIAFFKTNLDWKPISHVGSNDLPQGA